MKTKNYNHSFLFNEINESELIETKAGFAAVALAALGIAACKFVIDASYNIGYAVGYYQASH